LPAQCPREGNKFYDLRLTIDDSSFSLVAIPAPIQSKDKCGTLRLTNTGEKGADAGNAAACW
ncbi:MAG: type IV pilin, partial [Zoogloeaceae bacterium]|nr:type IV pilin [Zoogloeaceae bacterium]